MCEPSVVGRKRESGLLASLLDEVRERGAALVVTGIAGIGKTTLLQVARGIAGERDMLVLATAGIPAESNLPFAGLHRLLQPVLAQAGELPRPQREAMRAVFGMGDGTAPEPFMIALGVLGLVSEAAASRPLLMSGGGRALARPPDRRRARVRRTAHRIGPDRAARRAPRGLRQPAVAGRTP